MKPIIYPFHQRWETPRATYCLICGICVPWSSRVEACVPAPLCGVLTQSRVTSVHWNVIRRLPASVCKILASWNRLCNLLHRWKFSIRHVLGCVCVWTKVVRGKHISIVLLYFSIHVKPLRFSGTAESLWKRSFNICVKEGIPHSNKWNEYLRPAQQYDKAFNVGHFIARRAVG